MRIEAEIEKLGLVLPTLPPPAGNYLPGVQVGNLLFVSGATGASFHPHRGRLGQELGVEEGYECARYAVLSNLAAIKAVIGDLDRVERFVKLLGFINAAEGFGQTPQVLNGASDLLVQLYGENGRHARSAIGVAALPANAPVEIEMIVQLK